MKILEPIFDLINRYILQWPLRLMMLITNNNFAASIFLFTLVINILLIPLSIKSQKATVQQTLVKPKLDKLREKCGDDKRKYNTEMQELYQRENIKMSGGCLPMLLRMLLLFSVYCLVISPLTYLSSVDAGTIEEAIKAANIPQTNSRAEIDLIGMGGNGNPVILEAIKSINFNFLGIDLTTTPHFTFNLKDAQLNWIIPFLSFAGAMASSIISLIMQKKNNPDAPSMSGMMLTMPILSLVFAFMAPCGLGFYWACSSIIGGIIQAGIQYFYGPYKMIAKQRAKKIIKEYENESAVISAR